MSWNCPAERLIRFVSGSMAHFITLQKALKRIDLSVLQNRDSRDMELIVMIRIPGISREDCSSWAEISFLADQLKIHPSALNYAR